MPVERAGEEENVSAKHVIMLLVGTKLWVQLDVQYIGNRSFFHSDSGPFECRRMGGPVLQYRTVTQHDRH